MALTVVSSSAIASRCGARCSVDKAAWCSSIGCRKASESQFPISDLSCGDIVGGMVDNLKEVSMSLFWKGVKGWLEARVFASEVDKPAAGDIN